MATCLLALSTARARGRRQQGERIVRPQPQKGLSDEQQTIKQCHLLH